MSVISVKSNQVITSAASQANGTAVNVGGRPISVQFQSPAALAGLEGSMDKFNWVALDDDTGTAIATLTDAVVQMTNTPTWVRPIVAIDASQPRTFYAMISILKQGEG